MVQLYHNRNVNINSLLFKVDYTSIVLTLGKVNKKSVNNLLSIHKNTILG